MLDSGSEPRHTLVPVWYATPFDGFTPDDRVMLAVMPVALAICLRILLGRTQFTRWSATLGAMWFAINVLLAPYSEGMRVSLMELGQHFR
jgi:hypothetical protein